MISSTISTGNTMRNGAWTCSTEGATITLPPPSEERDFCVCKYVPSYCETAFYDLNDVNDEYRNDYHLEYVLLKASTSTAEFFLIQENGNEITIDSSLGTIYPLLFNLEQPFMVGFRLDWWRVAFTYGTGKYQIKIVQNNLGQENTKTSHYYNVVPFIEERANNTVKIEVLLEGLTMNGNNWLGLTDNIEMTRVHGRLSSPQPQKETEDNRLLTSGRNLIDIQTTVFNNYSLTVQDLPYSISKFLMQEGTVMNWFITDYNLFVDDEKNQDYRKLRLLAEGVEVTQDNPFYTRESYDVSLTDRIIKLNRKFVSNG